MASPSTMTAPSLGVSSPARILSTVVLPQPEWPITQANSPRWIDSHRFSNTATSPPAAPGYRFAIASIEMNLSVIAQCSCPARGAARSDVPQMRDPLLHAGSRFCTASLSRRSAAGTRELIAKSSYSFRERHHAGEAREDLIEQHADKADQENGDNHIGDREVVPLVPDEVTDAGAADQHFGGHDHEPGNADRNPHAGQNGRRRCRQDHGERTPQRADLERARDVDPFLAHRGNTERRIEQHWPDRADKDHKDRRQAGILDRVERKRHPGERRDRLQDLDERIECPADQRRHPDQKAEWNRDEHGEQIAETDARDRIAELDAESLVVRTIIEERPLQVLPQLGADLERARHRRLALRCGYPHQFGIFRTHGADRGIAAGGEVPDADEG